MKKLLLFFFYSFFAHSCAMIADKTFSNVFYMPDKHPQGISAAFYYPEAPRPQIKMLFAFDLNGVIFESRYSIIEMFKQTAVIKKYGFIQTTKLLNNFIKLYRKKRSFKKANDPKGFVWDAMFCYLEDEVKTFSSSMSNQELAQLLRQFSQAANHLDYKLMNYIYTLESAGHHSVVLSNMGQGILNVQIQQLKEELTQAIDDQKRKLLEFAISFLTQPTNVVASKANNWLHKPDYDSYKLCLNQNYPTAHQGEKVLTIFIDDKIENIEASLKSDLFDVGIYYKNADDFFKIITYLLPHLVLLNK